jgi:tetratricopeptide (TPR) repeat protein
MLDELPRAYTSYQQALHHFPTPKSEPKLWYGIGILYDRYGSLEHAEEAFSSVIMMDPRESETGILLARELMINTNLWDIGFLLPRF